MTPRELLRQAKIDHYLRFAEECYGLSRYTAARRYLDQAFALDPQNAAATLLRESIDSDFRAMVREYAQEGGNGSRGESLRRRKDLALVVDQDERTLSSCAQTLRRHGYGFLGAGAYEEAVDLMNRVTPDVVVSEVNFEAGPRGFDLFQWLRTSASHADVPFLFYATRLDNDLLVAGKRFGVDDFLLKPTDGEVIVATVARAIQRRRKSVS